MCSLLQTRTKRHDTPLTGKAVESELRLAGAHMSEVRMADVLTTLSRWDLKMPTDDVMEGFLIASVPGPEKDLERGGRSHVVCALWGKARATRS